MSDGIDPTGTPLTPLEAVQAHKNHTERAMRAAIDKINETLRTTSPDTYPKRLHAGGNKPYAAEIARRFATVGWEATVDSEQWSDSIAWYVVLDRPKTVPGGPYR